MKEILHELIWRIAHYLQGFIPGGAGFLPSTVWLPDFSMVIKNGRTTEMDGA